ncbi:hypothetical protein BH10PSE1_BH10PSE1_01320 [soil metagenome]
MHRLALLVLILGLAACDGEDPVTSATREIATANQAKAAVAQIKAEAEAREAAGTATPATAACDVEVSFGSFGAGVDAPLHGQILALTRANPDVTTSTEEPWGREGETTLCLMARDEAATDRLYGMIAAQLPSTSTRAPTTVRHRDGRSRAATYPTGA